MTWRWRRDRSPPRCNGTPVVLVLDNLHEITRPVVHESLLRLVHRPPPGLRIVATTRRDPPWPLHRLRLAGVLTEIRAADLAFREDETRALLDGLGIDLDPVHVGRLVERTEGWAAGLRLAALELQGAADPTGFVDAFSGDDHAVAAYLLDEVIDRLAPELLDFLVRVSVLDVVSADLADALTGSRNGAATLADLAASNLFVHAVGPAGQWYRLHRLLADLLRSRITEPRTLRDLHRRAAEWYLHQAMPLEAVRYALRGGLWPLAAEVLGRHLLALVVRGNPRNIDMLLAAVPRDALLSHPELAAALAGARIMQGSPAEVGELTAAAHAGADRLPAPRAERLRVVLHLIEIGHGRARGDLARCRRRLPADPQGYDRAHRARPHRLGRGATARPGKRRNERILDRRSRRGGEPPAGRRRPRHLRRGAAASPQRRGPPGPAALRAGRPRRRTEPGACGGRARSRCRMDRVGPGRGGLPDPGLGGARPGRPSPRPTAGSAASPRSRRSFPSRTSSSPRPALTALRRADAGDPVGALSGLQLTTARLAGSTPPALTDRLLQVEADLLRRIGDVARASDVLAGLRGPATASSARAVGPPAPVHRGPRGRRGGAGPVPRTTARRCAGVSRAPSCAA